MGRSGLRAKAYQVQVRPSTFNYQWHNLLFYFLLPSLPATAAASACFFTSSGACCSQKRKLRPPGNNCAYAAGSPHVSQRPTWVFTAFIEKEDLLIRHLCYWALRAHNIVLCVPLSYHKINVCRVTSTNYESVTRRFPFPHDERRMPPTR